MVMFQRELDGLVEIDPLVRRGVLCLRLNGHAQAAENHGKPDAPKVPISQYPAEPVSLHHRSSPTQLALEWCNSRPHGKIARATQYEGGRRLVCGRARP